MTYTAVIPLYDKDRDCVDPTNTWMLPFVTPGVRTGTPTALDPSISPVLVTLDKGVEMWWRWAALDVEFVDLGYGFGTQTVSCTRYIAPWNAFGGNTEVDEEKLLAKKEAHVFHGTLLVEIGLDTLNIDVDIKIFPPRGTEYGDEFNIHTTEPGWPQEVDDAYQINEGAVPADVDCVPVIIITIVLDMSAGPEVVNVMTNYGPSDSNHPLTLGGNALTIGNYENGTSIPSTDPGDAFEVTIEPSAWYSWNGTWDIATGARN